MYVVQGGSVYVGDVYVCVHRCVRVMQCVWEMMQQSTSVCGGVWGSVRLPLYRQVRCVHFAIKDLVDDMYLVDYIFICIYTCIYTYIHINIHEYICICTPHTNNKNNPKFTHLRFTCTPLQTTCHANVAAFSNIYVYIYMYIYKHICIHIHVYLNICVYICIYICIYVYIYKHIYMYI